MIRRQIIGFTTLGSLMVIGWLLALFWVSTDANQGDVYRILYLHVPCSFTAFLSAGVLFIFSLIALVKKNPQALITQKAAVEVGLIFTILSLATGSIWGKPTWNTWWTWDARVTTTLILGVLFAAYLIFYDSVSSEQLRLKACSILGLIIAGDVPVIYQSVNWWRTLHQPQTILRSGGSTMAPEMLYLLLYCCVTTFAFGLWLIIQRKNTIQLRNQLEDLQLLKFS